MLLCQSILHTDSQPPTIEDLLIDLEDALTASTSGPSSTVTSSINAAANEIIKPLSLHEAGWLARAIREKVEKDRENLSESMEQELNVRLLPYHSSSRHRIVPIGIFSYTQYSTSALLVKSAPSASWPCTRSSPRSPPFAAPTLVKPNSQSGMRSSFTLGKTATAETEDLRKVKGIWSRT